MDGEMIAGLTVGYARKDQAWKGVSYGEGYFKEDSTNILVNRALADAYFMDRKFDKSAAMYERLLQQRDSTFNTLYSAGMCYAQLDSLELAYQDLLLAFLLSGMQHAGCAYRLGVVCVDTHRLDEGIGYLDLATKLLLPDTVTMKAITLSQGEANYWLRNYDKAIEAWKKHLEYNPNSIATYYNIANAIYYYLSDDKQAKSYYEKFLTMARKEENPNAQLKEMMEKAETLLRKSKVR
jgi:tetratricopeptide (TPR) repeat protein